MKILQGIALSFSISVSAHADIYKWTDANGKVHFSDRKPKESQAEEVKVKTNTYKSTSFSDSGYDVGNKVIMYSTDWCGYCKQARAYFRQQNIPYTEYNIEKDRSAKQRHAAMGAKGVPVILVGKQRMNGFSIKGFERLRNNKSG